MKNPEIKYHPKTADENSCVSKAPSQNWRPNTEPLQCHWLPATAFRRLKIQIPITFTMRPSHVPGNKHLQKKQRSQVHQKHINDQCGSAARVSMSKCPILVHEHRVLIAQMNYCIKTDAKNNVQAKHRQPPMPLAAHHSFSNGSKSRSQETSQRVQGMFKAKYIYKNYAFSIFDHTTMRKKTHQNELDGWKQDGWALALAKIPWHQKQALFLT